MKTFLKELAEQIDVKLSDKMVEQFFIYKDLLKEWNEKINLTAITDEDEVAVKHFLDCLSIKALLPDGASVADVGTGAGFPGIPLKIANPTVNLTLVDSLNKRTKFLAEAVQKLNLENTEIVWGRAEDVGKDENHREKYDICVSRAVANLTTLCELCLPFVKVGGKLICLKGPKASDEAAEAKRAIKILGGELEGINEYEIPDADLKHNAVIIKKISQTPTKYPRKAPKPAKEPLY